MEKLRLKEDQLERISNIEFKPEGLGALEFTINMVDETWQEKPVDFRLERVSPQTFLKIAGKEGIEKSFVETLSNFVALPVEARNIDFFKFDTGAMEIVGTISNDFQKTPLVFREGAEAVRRELSK